MEKKSASGERSNKVRSFRKRAGRIRKKRLPHKVPLSPETKKWELVYKILCKAHDCLILLVSLKPIIIIMMDRF